MDSSYILNYKSSQFKNKVDVANMNADLGLFNQLLQMIDGDWSDSIQGICNYILERFNAEGVILSILDKNFNEFIYVTYSISENCKITIEKNEIKIDNELVNEIVKMIYAKNQKILEFGVFDKSNLLEPLCERFKSYTSKIENIFNDLNIENIFAVPILEAKHNYRSIIHILTGKNINSDEKNLINEYLYQLNVALEIVFLVRELYIKATHDGLTKLFNHKQGDILLDRELNHVIRSNQDLTLVMMDIDFFKKVNDEFGHQAGDMVLEYIGNLLTEQMRKSDIVIRYGGEEFMIVLLDAGINTSIEVIQRLKDRVQNNIFQCSGVDFSITASFGMVQFDKNKHDGTKSLIEQADKNLYKAKENGRNRIEY